MRFLLLFFVAWLLLPGATWAAAAGPTSQRQSVGIALSGGGARGIAHVGVLKALEELQVPVDYVAGTSMGSIVGGLYAIGNSPDELEQLVHGIDWDAAFADSAGPDQISWRDKLERRRYNLPLEFGLGSDRGVAPSGIIAGHNLQLILRRLTGAVSTTEFDQLAIPFRAVATDIQRGEPYAIERGDLATAIRASMAVPLAFDPVELDGRVLVDGGVLNNLPVDVARDMGADLVIGVNIASPLGDISADSSFINVTYQSIDVALVRNTIESLAEADLIIAPALGDYSAANFSDVESLVVAGYDAVMRRAPFLRGLALNDADWQAHLASRADSRTTAWSQVDYVEFTGNDRTSTRRLSGLAGSLVGHPADLKAIEQVTRQMMALGSFNSVGYEFVENQQGKQGIRFLITEKPWGPHYLRIGLELSADLELEAEPTLRLQHRWLNANPYGGEWSNELVVGTDYGLSSEFYQPLGFDTPWFLSAYGDVSEQLQRQFTNNGQQELAQYDLTRYRAGLDVGLAWPGLEVRAGAFAGEYRSNQSVGVSNSDFALFDDREAGWRFALHYDAQERPVFATRGWRAEAQSHWYRDKLGAEADYEQYRLNAIWRHPIGSDGAFHLELLGEWFDGELTNSAFVSFGGLDDFAGYADDALLGRRAALLRVGGFSKVQPLELPLIGAPRVIALLHAGQVWEADGQRRFDDFELGALTGLGVELFQTSAFFGVAYSDQANDARFYLRFGNWF